MQGFSGVGLSQDSVSLNLQSNLRSTVKILSPPQRPQGFFTREHYEGRALNKYVLSEWMKKAA